MRGQFGLSYLDVYAKADGEKTRPVFTEKWSATWSLDLPLWEEKIRLNYTGNLYGPMRLPLLNRWDPRREFSPVWSIQNIKVSYRENNQWTFFAGVKNLLNWTPAKNNPFLIAGADNPFDRGLTYDNTGAIERTPTNPYGLSFDPTYIYASNQGIRFFIGLNLTLNK